MDKCTLNILDKINEGIVILNEEFEIRFWSKCMEERIGLRKEEVQNKSIFEIFPNLDKGYFRKAFQSALDHDHKHFFTSELHKDIISEEYKINLKVNKVTNGESKYLMLEFIDYTNQFIRVNQLKGYVEELYILNKKLQDKEKEIERLAYYDKLTNVANRTLFYKLAEKLVASSQRDGSILGLMFIDIDKFKDINDQYGHVVGDKVLIEVARILSNSLRENDMVARHGGDEFLILLPDLKEYNNYKIIADRIGKANKNIKIDDNLSLDISFSIGVSFHPKDGKKIDELISKADKAMYKSKRTGGNTSNQYDN